MSKNITRNNYNEKEPKIIGSDEIASNYHVSNLAQYKANSQLQNNNHNQAAQFRQTFTPASFYANQQDLKIQTQDFGNRNFQPNSSVRALSSIDQRQVLNQNYSFMVFDGGDNLSDYCLSQRKRSVHTGMTNRVLHDHERYMIRKSFQTSQSGM